MGSSLEDFIQLPDDSEVKDRSISGIVRCQSMPILLPPPYFGEYCSLDFLCCLFVKNFDLLTTWRQLQGHPLFSKFHLCNALSRG